MHEVFIHVIFTWSSKELQLCYCKIGRHIELLEFFFFFLLLLFIFYFFIFYFYGPLKNYFIMVIGHLLVMVFDGGYSICGRKDNLKVDPYKYHFLSWKCDPFIYQLVPFLAKLWAKLPDFSKIFWFWANFGSNLGKFWKIDQFIYQNWFI